MVRPLRAVLKSTTPGRVAKIVWSRPRPVPSPGRKRVPRWRTMISPPLTRWPANTLTPSIFGVESRPLRDEPSPFLWAIYEPSFFARDFAAGFRAGFFGAAGFLAEGFFV